MSIFGYLNLGTGLCGLKAETPPAGVGYARQPVIFTLRADGTRVNETLCTFGPVTGSWGKLICFDVVDGDGNPLVAGNLAVSLRPTLGQLVTVQPGNITWYEGAIMLNCQQAVPFITVVATGTSQLTAAPIAIVAKALINAGSGGGVCLPASCSFDSNTMIVFNRTGGTVTVYPHAGDTIENSGVNVGIVLQDEQTAHFNVANSGLLIMS